MRAIDTKNLITFLRAAEIGSFSKVAEELGYAPSTISMQIQQLEEELGYKLFDRLGKQIALTHMGEAFVKAANEICVISQKSKLINTDPDQLEGVLRIGALESLMASELIPLLPDQYSAIFPKISLTIKTAGRKELFAQLRRNEVDIIFLLGAKIDEPDCATAYARPELLMFVTNVNHPLANCYNVPLGEVLAQRLILTDNVSIYRKTLEQVAHQKGIELKPYIQTDNTRFIISLLTNSIGVSFLPEYTVRPFIEAGKLAPIYSDSSPIQCWSQAFYHKNKWLSPQLKGLLDLIKGGKYPNYFSATKKAIEIQQLEIDVSTP